MSALKISLLDTGFFKLDGGAMFGVVPKSMWKKMNPPDDNNMCTWAMRCLLIESGDRKIVVDTGLGNKQDEKFRSHFYPHGDATLLGSLKAKGLTPSDITDVFQTHLHFDHVGGAVTKNKKGELVPTFPNATYWSNQDHYNAAINPNPREKASFLKENIVPLFDHKVLKFIPVEQGYEFIPGVKVYFMYGHTDAMMTLEIESNGSTYYYCADLLPSSFHIGIPYVMSYDLHPLKTMEEKTELLAKAVDRNMRLIFEHDPVNAVGTVKRNERGRIVLDEVMGEINS